VRTYRPACPRPHPARVDGAIDADGLVVELGRRPVLHGLTFTIPRGQVTGLLGPSGCGKTTLMRCVVGVVRIAGGRLSVLGCPAGTPSLRRRVGYVTQAASVYTDLTAQQNVRYFAALYGVPASTGDAALAEVALEELAGRPVSTLSGGERARVSLACALLARPEVLVLDEPTVGLDPVLRRELWDLFRRLSGEGRTVFVSSHVMDEASRCDRLLLLREGRILSDSTLAELLASTGTADAEQAFLALIDAADAAERAPGIPGIGRSDDADGGERA
jgi:ABC-2 type transport system ATP-binding protein